MAEAAQKSGQPQQEGSIRAAVEAYFERAEDAPEAPSNSISLPLSEKTGFLAKDVRMLRRDTSEKACCWPELSMRCSVRNIFLKLLVRL